MNNTIQLYADKAKKIKAYPITSPDRVVDENGVSIKKQLRNNVKFAVVSEGDDVPEIDGKYDDTELRDKIKKINIEISDARNGEEQLGHTIRKFNEELDRKIDKNGDGQITFEMLSQGAKDVISGNAPLTNVGIGGVTTYDLSNNILRNLCTKELISFVKTQEGGYMNASLSFTAFSNYYYSLRTDLVEGELLSWTGLGQGSAVYGIIFVNSNGGVISKHFVGNDIGGIQYDEFIRVPVGTSKAYFNFHPNGKIKVYRYKLNPVVKGHELQEEIERAKYAETHIEPRSLTDATIDEGEEESELIMLDAQNTDLLEGQVYNKQGVLEKSSDGRYSTLCFKVGKYKKFVLSNYRIGVHGGAFLKEGMKWISSFATDNSNADIPKEVPSNATHIAITVQSNSKYKAIQGFYNNVNYKLNRLILDSTQLVDSEICKEEIIQTVLLNTSNTELLSGQLYTSGGKLESSDRYSTLYFNVQDYTHVMLSNYRIGVYGGAFVTKEKTWISSFATDNSNADIPKEVPKLACYIAITVINSDMYRSINCYYTKADKYKLKNLTMDSINLTDAEVYVEKLMKPILLNTSNTELLSGQLYTSGGKLESSDRYSTLYFNVQDYTHVMLSNYRIGVYGGAFVTKEKTWISSFATDGDNANIKKEVPKLACYIAITVINSDMYKTILVYYTKMDRFKLKNLVLDDEQEITRNNHWKGKKIGFLGTSVLFGANATKSYAQECANKLGFTLKNFGVPGLAIHTQDNGDKLTYGSLTLTKAEYQAQGKTIPSSPIEYVPGGSYNDYYRTYENIFTEENKDIDLWVYAVTPNNSNFDLKDWNLFDKNNWRYTDDSSFKSHRTTFIGALLFLMDKMYTLNPNARMVLLLDSAFAYSSGKKNFEEIQKHWNMPIIDLWGRINTSPKSLSKLKSKDGTDTHPSTFAHEKMGNMLANEILLIS